MAKISDLLKSSVADRAAQMKLNQGELADLLGIKPQQFSRQLSGKQDARISLIEKIATTLQVPPFYLLMTESERAQWDSKTKSNEVAIEERLAKLEYQLSELTSESRTPLPLGHSIPALEALAQEMQRVIGEPASEKRERKKGNG